MPCLSRLFLIPIFAVLLVVSHVSGSPMHDSVDDRFEQMQAEIERLREDNRSMRSELEDLRLKTEDNWLNEQRAEEIRGIVIDVLADADTRASFASDGLMAGWSDGFFLASADGRFKLGLEGLVQARWMYNYRDQIDRHRKGFELSRTRLGFRGHVFSPDMQYLVRGEFLRQGGGFVLRDAWMRHHFDDQLSVRFGQFKLPFSRETLVSTAHQLAVERSLVDTNLGIGRSQGVELTYTTDLWRLSGAFSQGGTDSLGGFGIASGRAPANPTNTGALIESVEYAWTARYEHLIAGHWSQFRDFTSPVDESFGMLLGVAGHVQRDEAGGPTPFFGGRNDTRWFAYTVDASMEFGGANLFGSFTHHYIDAPTFNVNVFGVIAQGGFFITPKVEVFGRYEFGHWSVSGIAVNFSDLHAVTAGVNYYIDGHDLKWTTDIGVGISRIEGAWGFDNGGIVGWRSEGPDARPQIVFRTQFQLLF